MIWIKSRKTYLNFSLRCDECSDLRLDWQKLSRNLKDQGIGDVVVSQVNCCIEYDLCDTFDRQTKCLDTIKNRGNVERYPFHYEINSQNLNFIISIILFIKERMTLHIYSHFRKRDLGGHYRIKCMYSETSRNYRSFEFCYY